MRDDTARRLSRLHSLLYRGSGGLLGRRLVDNDMLLLTTRGRRSGRPHRVPLLYLREGADWYVIASWGGRPNHPEWYLNLIHSPDAFVRIGRHDHTVRAETLDDEDRAAWWPRVVGAYHGYDAYQARTSRTIPVVRLRRIQGTTPNG